MGVNGVLYLAWFLSPPNPDRIGFWYCIYFNVFPVLGILGIVALILKKPLHLSWWVGTLLVFYVGFLTFLANNSQLVLMFLRGGFENFHVVVFTITLIGLLIAMLKR